MSAIRTLRRALGRGTLAALALTAAATAAASTLHAQSGTTGPFTGRYEYCFGGVGPMCAGAPGSPNGWSSTNNATMMYVSVGSILHDNCCLRDPQGKWCGGVGVDGSGKAEEWNHNGNCVKEWDKAWWNTLDNRQWRVRIDHGTPSNLSLAEGRPSRLKDGAVVTREEVAASRQYAAPAGVSVDVGDQAFCASGRATEKRAITGVRWMVCQ